MPESTENNSVVVPESPDDAPPPKTPPGPLRETLKRFLGRLAVKDATLHASIASRFPKSLWFFDLLFGWVFDVFCHPAFAAISALLLFVLGVTGRMRITVAVSVFVAWLIAVLWIARSHSIKNLSILARFVIVVGAASVFAFAGSRFGIWALHEYQKQQAKQPNVELSVSDQIRATQFAAALDDPVGVITIVLTLKQDYEFAGLCPIESGFELLGRDSSGASRRLRISFHDEQVLRHSEVGDYRGSSYKISWGLDESEARSFFYTEARRDINKIVLPVLYRGSSGEPFVTLRDFKGALFHPWLQQSLLEKVGKIELLVNGWAIVAVDPASAHWQSETASWPLFKTPVELNTPWTTDFHQARPPRGLWWINFLDKTPQRKHEQTLPWLSQRFENGSTSSSISEQDLTAMRSNQRGRERQRPSNAAAL